jgi:hypothetical protein
MTRRFVLIVAALITWLAFSSVAAPQSTPGISVLPKKPETHFVTPMRPSDRDEPSNCP